MTESQLWVWYTPFGLGGVEVYLLQMCRELLNQGSKPAVAAVTDWGELLAAEYPAEVLRLDWTAFHAAYMAQAPAGPVAALLARDCARLRPRLLVINDCADFALGALPLLERLRPFCTILDVLHIDSPDGGYFARRRAYAHVLDGVVSTNSRALERLAAGGVRAPGVVVANGVPLNHGPRAPRGSALRILYVGRLEQRQKRVLELPAVLSRLAGTGRAFEATLVGTGPDAQGLADALAAAGVADRATLLGARPPHEVRALYLRHDVLLSLSAYEGYSLAQLEALAAGCVPVLTDLPSLDPLLFEHNATCMRLPVEQVAGAAARTLAALTDDDLLRLAAEGRRRASLRTPAATCAAYLDFVETLRTRRPLRVWPEAPAGLLPSQWDLTRLNPWLPRPHPLRTWLRSMLGDGAR